MTHGEETKQLLERVFHRAKDDPEDWGAMAWTLRTAADVLLEAYSETWDGPDREPVNPQNEHLDAPASMLYGCALENMIKGYLIKKHGGFEKARAAQEKPWNRHQLSRLAEATGLALDSDQKLLLRSLEAFVVWAGRYPISMKPEQYTLRTGKELKKGEILKARKKDFLDVVCDAGPGLQSALETLFKTMGVIDDSYLPFKDLIALIGATHSVHSSQWEQTQRRVVAFLWATCLVEDWDSSTNDKTRYWFRHLGELLTGKTTKDQMMKLLGEAFPSFEDVRDATSKASLTYRTFMAFNLAKGGNDWAGVSRSTAESQEDHHIFPRDWLGNNRDQTEDKQLWASLRDSVLNRVFVSKKANSDARAQTPPNYLIKLTAAQRRVLQIPESFLGPLETPIKSDAFGAFLKDRYDLMKEDFIDHVRQNL